MKPVRQPTWTRIAVSLAVISAFGASATAAARPRPARCQGGYYVIDGSPLVPGGAVPDALIVDRGAVASTSGCPPTRAKVFKGAGKHDVLLVKWPACGTLKKAMLQATISVDCASLSGKFKAKGARGRKLTASNGVPEDLRTPWGSEPLPPGAVFVTPAEFLDASTQPGFRVLTPTQAADDEAAAAAVEVADQATLDEFAAAHPARADYVSFGVDLNDPEIQSTGDGNYQIVVYDSDSNGKYVVTQGPRYQRAVRADTIRTFPTQANQLAVYRQLYAFAHDRLDPTLPSPEDVAGRTAEELAVLNRDISGTPAPEGAALLPGEELPESFPSRCSNEIGSGDGTDGSAYCQHRTDGLWLRTTWPLKYFATCVKDQANRGTCTGFAVTAGRELRAARRYHRWLNLSEQHLWFNGKRVFQPGEYGDGLYPAPLLRSLLTAGYQQPLEQDWDYNPSDKRTKDERKMKYASSCVDYGGGEQAFCSDTTHQGRVICMQQGAGVVCAVTAPPPGATTVRATEQPAELWDPADPVNGLRNVIISLLNQVPVVVWLDVTRAFKTPNANGFVHFSAQRAKRCRTVAIDPTDPSRGTGCEQAADCQCVTGGHSVLAVGYIPEQKLPAGTPESTGGFLIVKNSWGCVGDGGYFYLPASWVRTFVVSATPVGEVEVVGPLPDQPVDNFTFPFTPSPPSIRVVQPLFEESFVAGQGIPLRIEGVDYQNDQWVLSGPVHWTSDLQGEVGEGQSTITTLIQGTHHLTASYTGTLGVTVTAKTTVAVGPAPPDLPPTPLFTSRASVPLDQCPGSCGDGADTCIVGFGYGSDPEDGALTDAAHVRWFFQRGNLARELGSTGASVGSQGKFIGCFRACGTTFKFILEVEDSHGQRTEARDELTTPGCVS